MIVKIEDAIKQKKFVTQQEKVIVNIIYTNNWLRDMHAMVLKPYHLLMQHYNVLRILKGKYPEVVSPSEIKAVMLDKGNDLTRLLDKLVKMELVERNLCPSNRRKMDLKLTEKGDQLILDLTDKMDAALCKVYGNLTDEESSVISDLLDKLRQ